MVRRSRRKRRNAPFDLVVFVLVMACGGRSERTSGDDDEGRGGSSAASGSAGTSVSAGTSGIGGTRSAIGGTGTTGGTVGTSGAAGSGGGCTVDGVYHPEGEPFLAPDGCNTCTCYGGAMGCTTIGCPLPPRCGMIVTWWSETVNAAKYCDPTGEFQCWRPVSATLPCGCVTYVSDPVAIEYLDILWREWQELGCDDGIECKVCPPDPLGARCTEGVCVDYR